MLDDGDGGGPRAARILDLVDNVLLFPKEFDAKLWREMTHEWEIDAAVLLQPGICQEALAFTWETKRAISVVRNKAHRDFVNKSLAVATKRFSLAPDRRLVKPFDFAMWAASRAAPGGAPAAYADVGGRVAKAIAASSVGAAHARAATWE